MATARVGRVPARGVAGWRGVGWGIGWVVVLARWGGTTDSFGGDLRPLSNGLGFLPYSNGVHYNSEDQRRPLYHRLIADGTLPDGYATDDGVGLVYRGTELVEAVADQPDCFAYSVRRGADGRVEENVIEPRRLR